MRLSWISLLRTENSGSVSTSTRSMRPLRVRRISGQDQGKEKHPDLIAETRELCLRLRVCLTSSRTSPALPSLTRFSSAGQMFPELRTVRRQAVRDQLGARSPISAPCTKQVKMGRGRPR
jgi:hypothetical protein